MTMTSELKKTKTKRNSVNKFFTHHGPVGVKMAISTSTSALSQPSSSDHPTTTADESDKNVKVQKRKQRSVYLIQAHKVVGKIMVDDGPEEEKTIPSLIPLKPPVHVKKPLAEPPKELPKEAPPPPPPQPMEETTKFTSAAKAELTKKLEEANVAIAQSHVPPKRVRTFRIWHPNHRRRSLIVKIGGEMGRASDASEKIFNLKNIHAKSFEAWKREAKLQLPSATGGPAVENVEDVIHIVPTIQKDTDPKVMEERIRRLSAASKESEDSKGKKRASMAPKVDYAAVRVIPKHVTRKSRVSSEEDGDDESSEAKSEEDEDKKDTVIEIDSDDEEERLLAERRTAGADLKGKMQTLKELTENLTHKRLIRHHIVEKATGNTVLDAEYIPLKEHLLFLGEYIHDYLHDLFVTFLFWEKSINEMSARFGVVTASYFMWLRRLVILNLFMFLVTVLVIIVPQILEDEEETREPAIQFPFKFVNIFDGEGYFHSSYLFYSGYFNRSEDDPNPFKNPAFRFFIAITLIFFINTIFSFSHVGSYIRGHHLQSKVSGVTHNHNFTSIICGWDFSCGDTGAAGYLRKAIQRELHILATTTSGTEKETLEIETNKKKWLLAFLVKSFGLKWGSIYMHIFSNVLLIICCVIMSYTLIELCQVKLDYYISCLDQRDDQQPRMVATGHWLCPDGDLYLYSLVMSLPAVFASMAALSLNMIIVLVGEMESWRTTELRVYATMIRAGTFYATNLLTFYYFWINNGSLMREEGFVAETIFGKELYRLVVIKGILDVILNLGCKLIYHLIRKKSPNYKKANFYPEYNAMNMFFLHFVGGVGTLFCPGLSFLVLLRLVLDFYIHRYTLLQLSSNEAYSSHASTVYGPYVITFLVGYLLTAFMNMFYLADTKPSVYAGPFVNYTAYLNVITDNKNGRVMGYVRSIFQPGFLTALIAILAAVLYFSRHWAKAYEPIIRQLNDQIFLDRADRETLLKAIFEIGRATAATPVIDPELLDRKSFKRKQFPNIPKTDLSTASAKTDTRTSVEDGSMVPSSTPFESEVEMAHKPVHHHVPIKRSIDPRKREDISAAEHAVKAKEEKKKEKELKMLMKQVQGGKDTPLSGLQKIRKASVHVDTWNAQRHRQQQMEKIVKGIVGARKAAKGVGDRLNYDPTSKIFAKHDANSSGSSSPSSNSSNKPDKTKTKSGLAKFKSLSKIAKNFPNPRASISVGASTTTTHHHQQNRRGTVTEPTTTKHQQK